MRDREKSRKKIFLLGTGVVAHKMRLYRHVKFTIQELNFTNDFIILELEGANMILSDSCVISVRPYRYPSAYKEAMKTTSQ